MPAERRKQDDIGEPHQARVVLHEGGLGLLHARAVDEYVGPLLRLMDRHGMGAFRGRDGVVIPTNESIV
ncbi:predicted protein [Streptomyces filamentosus NRRL 15998]|uniref:Predicted protein n=1 Tax=Streptomyces filamentosus NRRL 15998 TaxID=457431 RepID=D6AEB0_STRFL|nr:predicted protein [Streptomyces filamentosus NRRL 15998]